MKEQVPPLLHVRLYQTLRSAHLERAHQLAPATIVFQNKRYDFETPLTVGLDIRQLSPIASAWLLLRSPVTVLEINEQLMLSSLKTTGLALAALWLRRAAGKRRTSVVTYAIGNADPFAEGRDQAQGTGLHRRAKRLLARLVWRRIDRVAFGTSAARETYETVLGNQPLESSALVFPALPAPFRASAAEDPPRVDALVDDDLQRQAQRVIFVGNFAERKGVLLLLDAWPAVRRERPQAELLMVGKGRLEPEVVAAERAGTGIRVDLDPERRRIHVLLESSRVLVLPSQPSPTWREQVGLPIVEGLSHGLTIVTTEQTGLAEWLGENGHFIVHEPSDVAELVRALLAALDAERSPQNVLASLPARDGRLVADDWLFSDAPTISDLARAFSG